MPYNNECRNEVPYGNDDVRHPVHRIGGYRSDIAVEAVKQIAVGVGGDIQPAGIHDLVKDVCLDLVVDAQRELRSDPVQDTGKNQIKDTGSDCQSNEETQLFILVSGDNINDVFAYNTGYQSKSRTENTKEGIEDDGTFIPLGIGKNELPVIQNFTESTFSPAPDQNVQGLERSVFVGFVGRFTHR